MIKKEGKYKNMIKKYEVTLHHSIEMLLHKHTADIHYEMTFSEVERVLKYGKRVNQNEEDEFYIEDDTKKASYTKEDIDVFLCELFSEPYLQHSTKTFKVYKVEYIPVFDLEKSIIASQKKFEILCDNDNLTEQMRKNAKAAYDAISNIKAENAGIFCELFVELLVSYGVHEPHRFIAIEFK